MDTVDHQAEGDGYRQRQYRFVPKVTWSQELGSIPKHSPYYMTKVDFDRYLAHGSLADQFAFIDDLSADHILHGVIFGGGATIDAAKSLAFEVGAPLRIGLLNLGINGFATRYVHLNSELSSLALTPAEILVGLDLIDAKSRQSRYGLAEIFALIPALHDCLFAKEGNDVPSTLLREACNVREWLLRMSFNNIAPACQFKLLLKSAQFANRYRDSSLVSGPEHIIAKRIEANRDIPHGLAVWIGILLALRIQGDQNYRRVIRVVTDIEIVDDMVKQISAMFDEIVAACEPRECRKTVFDRLPKSVRRDAAAYALKEVQQDLLRS